MNNVSITLSAGFTYVTTTAGPPPDMVSGQTLTWASLGNIPGGQSAVTIEVAVAASASGMVGFVPLGTLHAQYGDVYGEGFTADVCREVEVINAPAPQLDKELSPDTPNPTTPGGTVTWILTYSNIGTATLEDAVVVDVLPPGFVFVSSTPPPSQVIPGTPSTIVRWNVGDLPGPSGPFTITVNTLAPDITTSPTTFTNPATLTGTFTSGDTTFTFTDEASADVEVEKPPLQLGKSVSPIRCGPRRRSSSRTASSRSSKTRTSATACSFSTMFRSAIPIQEHHRCSPPECSQRRRLLPEQRRPTRRRRAAPPRATQ